MNPPDMPEIPYIPGGEPGRPLPPQFGPKPGALNWTHARAQVREMAVRLINRCVALGIPIAGTPAEHHGVPDPDTINRVSGAINMMLASPSDSARVLGATYVLAGLADLGEREDPDWWERDLGRIVAREVGSWTPAGAEHKVAAAALGVSRQAVGQMVRRGDLEQSEDGRITQESLRLAAERRWKREDDLV